MKKILLYTLAGSLLFSSCNDFVDVNDNPNAALEVPSKVLLPTTSIGIGWANANELGRCAAVLMQYNAGLANSALTYDSYNINDQFNNQWNSELFTGTINNLRVIAEQSTEKDPAYSGIAKIQMAYAFSLLTDLWGDVPYSQGGFGLLYPQPRFDKQEDIYQGNAALGIQSLFDLVKEGIADLDRPSVLKPAADDIIYKGDLAKWKKAGNSLILKLANTISRVNPTLAKDQINYVLNSNNGFIDDNAVDLMVPFSTTVSNQNPMYVYDISGSFKNNQMMSTRIYDMSKSLNDTVRLSKYYTKPLGTRFVGYNNGATVTAPTLATRSMYNTYVVGATGEAPVRLLTNFQMKFILAESALVLGTPGDVQKLYEDGIKASMTKVGMTTAEINNYFTTNPSVVTLSGSNEDKLKQIITQKYMSWVGNGIEAYNDWRRTGYPVLQPALNATGDNNGQIPLRYVYTSTESNANPNVPGIIRTNTKVWWGK
ncbi:SusD/RagB family nutrient-binding outer membrane lipoprotein [Sphingobacterium spiritivorum]|uniref:SusD/RagB family nutrient-binding outer membrane lipoprotein n=1 Tax=Sphingobacterium spiritivorum TaxID=258 RepID=UPI001918B065|nr:SusD/RagB family nutrient-binding outer membrane lipoprotein [Sphingobacterium spiritivorum]QQT27340.1 SusD/RagB family nutrient-binding outer membrane lipoprotein [Sphingobacterium spiritivorum]